MMNKTIRLLLMLLLVLSLAFPSALAAPRYPERQGYVTDAAAVLPADTVKGLNKVFEDMEDETGADVAIAVVDFLDGAGLRQYAAGLREQWDLDDEDALLVLAVGEDLFGLYGGKDFDRTLSPAIQEKLLSAHLHTPFMAQEYDAALLAFTPALIAECEKAWDEDIDLRGLPGAGSEASVLDAEAWLTRRVDRIRETTHARESLDAYEDEDTGIGPGKVLLTIFLLSVIFGKKNKRHDRRGCGCGCMPFSSILAALGLWKLWDKD